MRFAESCFFQNMITGIISAGSMLSVVLFLAHPIFSNDQSPVTEQNALESNPQGGQSAGIMGARVAGLQKEEAAIRESPVRAHGIQQETRDPPAAEPARDILRPMAYSAGGIVFDLASRKPVTGRSFRVTAYSPCTTGGPLEAVVDVRTGSFLFTGLHFGVYTISAIAEGYLMYTGNLMVPMEGLTTIALERGGTVRIKATDPYARRLTNLHIWKPAGPEELIAETLTSRLENGFYIVSGLGEGVHALHLEAPGFEKLVMRIQVSKEEERTYWALFE
jgi:hypothetical protein